MDTTTRRDLIATYLAGPDTVAAALTRIGGNLDRRPADGSWSAREIVHHLADSEMTSAIRLRRLIAEENPVIIGYDEELFARKLYYSARPVEASLAAVRAARETSADILGRLDESGWQRAGTHTESGPYSVETWLEIYAAHAHDHAAQMLRAAGLD